MRVFRLLIRLFWNFTQLCWHVLRMARRPWQFILDDDYRKKVFQSWRCNPVKRNTQLFLGTAVLMASIPAAWFLLWVGAQLLVLIPGI